MVAKKVGIFVQEFSVGMGPLLFSKQIGETEYSLRALPFGGFCRMQGETGDEDDEAAGCDLHVRLIIRVCFKESR